MAARTILYVEDDPEDIRVMEVFFNRFKVNYVLHSVSNGRDAIDRMKNSGKYTDRERFPLPEIILLDITMPDIDGFEVHLVLKRETDFRSIPVFVLTGSHNEMFRKRALELGATGFSLKFSTGYGFSKFLSYMNTRLMETLRYGSLIHCHRHDDENPASAD